jgi:hypothetical protein
MIEEPKGPLASRLRRRTLELAQRLTLPPDALPGSLALVRARCGKPNCRCASGEGHPGWLLTFMVAGRKQVMRIPREWVEEVQARVDAGREFKAAVDGILTSNAQLLGLLRKQRRKSGAAGERVRSR